MNLTDYLYSFMMKNDENKNFTATIKLKPLPDNCYECPFYYAPDPDDAGWAGIVSKTCFLIDLVDHKGIALKRYKNCPLRKG